MRPKEPASRLCRCRNCGNFYHESMSRAEVKGYCRQDCMRKKARSLGYKKPSKKWEVATLSEPDVLKIASAIGSVYIEDDDD